MCFVSFSENTKIILVMKLKKKVQLASIAFTVAAVVISVRKEILMEKAGIVVVDLREEEDME